MVVVRKRRNERRRRDGEARTKVQPSHLERGAYVYVRQSSPHQVKHNKESTRLQYERVQWALDLGWPRDRVIVVDGDQGQTATLPGERSAFDSVVGAVVRGEAGIVISLESARLARNGPDWAQLVFLCRWSDTLIADKHGIYDLTSRSDRIVLGVLGQLNEEEIETSIQRMIDARQSMAERGEMHRIPPPGYEVDDLGQLVKTHDEAVAEAIGTVFAKFDEFGSGRQVWAWWHEQGLKYPVRRIVGRTHPVDWKTPRYRAVLGTLHNPIYAGAYTYGRSRTVRELNTEVPGRLNVRTVKISDPDQWAVLIKDHHFAYVSWDRYVEIQKQLRANVPMSEGQRPGPVREGKALLQGMARCGHCGRAMSTVFGGTAGGAHGRPPQYRCVAAYDQGGDKVCQTIGSRRIDDVVVECFLDAIEPASLEIALKAEELSREEHEAMARVWQLQIEKAEYEAARAERQYQAVEPENRLVARSLERQWNERLEALEAVRAQAAAACRPRPQGAQVDQERIGRLAGDLEVVWAASTTSNRDKKALVRCLIEEVQLRTNKTRCDVRVVWKGGAITDRQVARRGRDPRATTEDTIDLVRKVALELRDDQIARVLNRQGRRTGQGNAFTAARVVSLRGKYGIPACPPRPPADPRNGPFTADEAANELGVCSHTIHKWLRAGILPGSQVTVGAPWRIRLTDEIRQRLGSDSGEAPESWVGLTEAARQLGLTKQHVSYLVRTGKLPGMRTGVHNRTCWRIDVSSAGSGRQQEMFDQMTNGDGDES